MSDINKGLPIRTENNSDAVVAIADATVTSRTMTVEADGSINTNSKITDGTDVMAVNGDGSINVVGPLTDTQLRASPVNVLVQSGLALESKQDDGNAILADILTQLGSAATEQKQDDIIGILTTIDSSLSDVSTSANQDITNSLLTSIDTTLSNQDRLITGTSNGQLSGSEFVFVNNIKNQILAAHDRNMNITYADFGTKNQRVTQIDYTSPTIGVGAGFTARKVLSYTLVGNNYRRDSINWTLI